MGTRSIRRRLALVAAPVLGAVGIVLVTAVPAWAHHPILSGQTSCVNGWHAVVWSIGNSEHNAGANMTFNSIGAHIGPQPYGVFWYSTVVPPSGSTNAASLVPGNLTGTIELNVSVHWTDDNINARGSTSVDLTTPCPTNESTSTTTSSTVAPSSTVVTAPETSSTIESEGSTISSSEAPTSTEVGSEGSTVSTVTGASVPNSTGGGSATGSGSLPFTGFNDLGPIVGASALLGGGALAFTRRKGR